MLTSAYSCHNMQRSCTPELIFPAMKLSHVDKGLGLQNGWICVQILVISKLSHILKTILLASSIKSAALKSCRNLNLQDWDDNIVRPAPALAPSLMLITACTADKEVCSHQNSFRWGQLEVHRFHEADQMVLKNGYLWACSCKYTCPKALTAQAHKHRSWLLSKFCALDQLTLVSMTGVSALTSLKATGNNTCMSGPASFLQRKDSFLQPQCSLQWLI